jgi:ergothioneine biosynthesis protein EgtB
VQPLRFIEHPGGAVEIGATASDGFVFDNELPRHRAWLEPFALADRLLTVREWKEFADAGGYDRPTLWLSDGFDFVRSNAIRGPLYGRLEGGAFVVFGLDGEREAADDEPVAHVSFYEADALATFFGARLPTEEEWEVAASASPAGEGNFRESGALRPLAANGSGSGLRQLFGDAWEWTRSSYSPYPGFAISDGALGEYNGKFMVNQYVLRGGSCFTPRGHVRATYRNFWHPSTRFQVTGVRLARSIDGRRAR